MSTQSSLSQYSQSVQRQLNALSEGGLYGYNEVALEMGVIFLSFESEHIVTILTTERASCLMQ